ncbi:MAG: PfkB family carbohydrate kinase [Acidimicrobiales bacterium]|nr:ribokinase [Actinomycetota bacterium]
MTSPIPTGGWSDAGPVLVVGDVLVDVVAEHRDPIAPGSDTTARIRLSGGGSAANAAAWLASLDVDVRLFAAVGDDDLGHRARSDLEATGVTFAGPVLEGVATGACVVLVGPDGDRTMLPDRGANDHLPVAAVIDALDPLPAWLHLSGYALLGEGSRNAGKAVLSAALAAGCPVSVDAASSAPLRAVGADAFAAWIDGAELLFANDDEVEALGGVRTLLDHVGAVVVKHGPAGASWTDGVETVVADGLAVDLVDPTGAGDAFAAGWIAARRRGESVAGALAAAVAVGATAVTRHGARPEAGGGR